MADFEGLDLNDPVSTPQAVEPPHPRAVGSPLPVGASPAQASQARHESSARHAAAAAPPPGRALPNPPPQSAPEQPFSSLQRAVNALRLALPFVQRLLPILDGHIPSTASAILTPHPPAPPVNVNLGPIEDSLADLQTQQKELRDQVAEQNSSLKRVEDHLEMVREATDRNTLEQQELMEDLKSVGKKVNILALIAFGLLAVSILLNVILYLHIKHVLP